MGELRAKEFILRGIAEHHRTSRATEWAYQNSLRADSASVDASALRLLLQEFGLLRTLDAKEGVRSVCNACLTIRKKLSSERRKIDWKDFFDHDVHDAIECSKYGKKGNEREARNFTSGITKVFWFTEGHPYPMFDRYTQSAVGGCGGKKHTEPHKAAKRFYWKLIDKLGYIEVHGEACRILSPSKLRAERVFDKAFFLKGIEKSNLKKGNDRKGHIFLDDDLLKEYRKCHDSKSEWATWASEIAEGMNDDFKSIFA